MARVESEFEAQFFFHFIEDVLRRAKRAGRAHFPPESAAGAVGGQEGEPDITVEQHAHGGGRGFLLRSVDFGAGDGQRR